MTAVRKIWPLLTATHRYDKSLSTHNRGHGRLIEAPILAYLIETANGRILYDVGCDYCKILDPAARAHFYDPSHFHFGPPEMTEAQRIPAHLSRLGLTPADIDVIFIGHLHFDHVGGLNDLRRCGCGAEIHVQRDELHAARSGLDSAFFPDELDGALPLEIRHGEYDLTDGIRAISTPGHTAGHMSMWVELPEGPPILLAGDAADLMENITENVAPGACWQQRYDLAVESILKLKQLAAEEGAAIWPNHDIEFFHQVQRRSPFHE